MSTLLLRFAGPVQSWGINSKFEVRRTENAPSKSGVTGLLAAALGIQRNEDISSLNQLRLGVRTDQEGRLLKDFHTAHSEKNSYITTRYYLSDAIFLVGLECEDKGFLQKLEYAGISPFSGKKILSAGSWYGFRNTGSAIRNSIRRGTMAGT